MAQTHLKLDDMIAFTRLMLRFQDVLRAVHLPRRAVPENDVEHSYQLAMMGWYLNTAGGLGYDADKLIRYALVHDLAEVYTGDIHAFDEAGRQGKAGREAEAIAQLAEEFPACHEIIQALRDYDAQADPEAKYIYALDKLMPMLMIYLEGGRTWREGDLKLERLHANKAPRVAVSEPISQLYQQLKALLDEQPELFPK